MLWAAIVQKNHERRANPALAYAVDGNKARVQKPAEHEKKREEEL
jgi:hypothetical protein